MSIDQTTRPDFTVTVAAVDQIISLGGAVRLAVHEGGCCGSVYRFEQVADGDDAPLGDERFGCPGAWLFVASQARDVLTGATLDYGASLKPPRFRILHNPNTEHVCACRRSFGEPWPGPRQPTCESYAPMPWDVTFEPPGGWVRRTGWKSSHQTQVGESTGEPG